MRKQNACYFLAARAAIGCYYGPIPAPLACSPLSHPASQPRYHPRAPARGAGPAPFWTWPPWGNVTTNRCSRHEARLGPQKGSQEHQRRQQERESPQHHEEKRKRTRRVRTRGGKGRGRGPRVTDP
eukprot:scaffold4643_cov35-Tisochrysis_lutea.AAC.2